MFPELRPGFVYTPAQVLPQAGRMLLLDSIDNYGPDWIAASLTIRPDSFGINEAAVPGWIGIEYLAQTAAAYGGIGQVQAGERPTIGLLLGTRRYDCRVPQFGIGLRLELRAVVVMQDDDGLAVFDCEILSGARLLALAQIKAYRPQDIREFLGAQPQ